MFIKYNFNTFTSTNEWKIVKMNNKNSKLLKLNAYIDNYNEFV